jgi:hypothetical protein
MEMAKMPKTKTEMIKAMMDKMETMKAHTSSIMNPAQTWNNPVIKPLVYTDSNLSAFSPSIIVTQKRNENVYRWEINNQRPRLNDFDPNSESCLELSFSSYGDIINWTRVCVEIGGKGYSIDQPSRITSNRGTPEKIVIHLLATKIGLEKVNGPAPLRHEIEGKKVLASLEISFNSKDKCQDVKPTIVTPSDINKRVLRRILGEIRELLPWRPQNEKLKEWNEAVRRLETVLESIVSHDHVTDAEDLLQRIKLYIASNVDNSVTVTEKTTTWYTGWYYINLVLIFVIVFRVCTLFCHQLEYSF